MQRIENAWPAHEKMGRVGYGGMVGRFRQEQIAQQSTWTRVPQEIRVWADMHVVHIVPENGSTTTIVNPVDPGDEAYYEAPCTWPSDKYQSTKGRPGFI